MADGITSDVEIKSIRAITLAVGLPSQVLDTGDLFDSDSNSSFEIISISSSSRSSSFDDQSDAELSSNSLSDKAVDALCRKIYKSRHPISEDVFEIERNFKEGHSSFNAVEDVVNGVVDSVGYIHDNFKQSGKDNVFSDDYCADEDDSSHVLNDNIDILDRDSCSKLGRDELVNDSIANTSESMYQFLQTEFHGEDLNDGSFLKSNVENVVVYVRECDDGKLEIETDREEMVQIEDVSFGSNEDLCEKIPQEYFEEESFIGTEQPCVKGVIIEDERNMSFDSSDEYNFSVMDTIVELSENSSEISDKSESPVCIVPDEETILDEVDESSHIDEIYFNKTNSVLISDYDDCESESVDFKIEAASLHTYFCDGSDDELISDFELDKKEEKIEHSPSKCRTNVLEEEIEPICFSKEDNPTFYDNLSGLSSDSELSDDFDNNMDGDIFLTNVDICSNTEEITNDIQQGVPEEPITETIVDTVESEPCEESENLCTAEIFARADKLIEEVKHLFPDDESNEIHPVIVSDSICIENDLNVSPIQSPLTLTCDENQVKENDKENNNSLAVDLLIDPDESNETIEENIDKSSLNSYENLLSDNIHKERSGQEILGTLNTLDDSKFSMMQSRKDDSLEPIDILQEIFHGVEDKFTKAVDEILNEEFNKLEIEGTQTITLTEVPVAKHEDNNQKRELLELSKESYGDFSKDSDLEEKIEMQVSNVPIDFDLPLSDGSISNSSFNGDQSFFNVSVEDLLDDPDVDNNGSDQPYSDKCDDEEESISVVKNKACKTDDIDDIDKEIADIASAIDDIVDGRKLNEEKNQNNLCNSNNEGNSDNDYSEYVDRDNSKEKQLFVNVEFGTRPKDSALEIGDAFHNNDTIHKDFIDSETNHMDCLDNSGDFDDTCQDKNLFLKDTDSDTIGSSLVSSCETEYFKSSSDAIEQDNSEDLSTKDFDKSSCVLISFGEKHSVYVASQPFKRIKEGD